MMLQDVDSDEIYRATLADSPSFAIDKVPSSHRFIATLLDPEFRFGWVLQMSGTGKTPKSHQVFQFGSRSSLGSLTLEGQVMRSSEQIGLSAVTAFLFRDANSNGIPDGLETGGEKPYAGAANTNVPGDVATRRSIPNPFVSRGCVVGPLTTRT